MYGEVKGEGFYRLQSWGFAPGEGKIESDRLSRYIKASRDSI